MPARRYQRRTRSLADRFWPKVRMTHTCWIWTAGLRNGYVHNGSRHCRACWARRRAARRNA